jgi:hypothetical protein
MAMSIATRSTIQLGNLVLDIYDSSHKDLVWRGNVSNTIRPDQEEAQSRQRHGNAPQALSAKGKLTALEDDNLPWVVARSEERD